MLFKLKPVVIGSILLGLGLPMACSTYYHWKTLDHTLHKEAASDQQRITEVVSLGVQKQVWDFAAIEAEPLLVSFMDDERIVRISVFDAKQTLLIEKTDEKRRYGEITVSTKDILFGDEVIGKVEVEFSFAKTALTLRERALADFLVTLGQMLFCALILVFLINRRIIARLFRISKDARKLASKELAEPFVWKNQDEIDQLGCSLEETRMALKGLFAAIEEKNLELEQMNQNLAHLVRERTARIALILDNVGSGFLLVNRDLMIAEGYSRSCESLFARTLLVGQNLTEVMNMDERFANHFQLAVDQVFEDMLPENVTISQLPDRVRSKDRAFAISGKAIKNAGKIESILFTIVDATKLEQSEREIRKNRAIIRILQNISAFRSFIDDSRDLLLDCMAFAEQNDQQRVRLELHTLKGNVSVFNLSDVADLIHRTEDFESISRANIEDIEKALKNFLAENHEIIKVSYDEEQSSTVEIEKVSLDELKSTLRRVELHKQLETMVTWIEEVQKIAVESQLLHLPQYAERLGKQLGKSVALEIHGGDLKVDAKRYKAVLQNLIHLIRNAIDHGIEAPDLRGSKPEIAKIELQFKEDAKGLHIVVKDDGAGIQRSGVAKRALERKLRSKAELDKMSDKEVHELIFLDGLSTAATVSDISGRGIGMASVLQSVKKLGGNISIDSKPGQGSTFTLTVPPVDASQQAAA